ncbi:MAG: hypothetical protein JXR52_01470 [Bacteroidales bacterium]|nr:hypothetical protein [Bacteroidales bacterium]MBN2697467.1 hypothetical protein [Bacteroidales bacterium]
MKKILISSIVLISIVTFSCQTESSIEKEKQAIMSVIQNESEFARDGNVEGLVDLYVQDEYNTRIIVNPESYYTLSGWDTLGSFFEQYKDRDEMDLSGINVSKENPIIKIMGNKAWLICDNIWEGTYEGEYLKNESIQVTFLEKVNGSWKISFAGWTFKPETGKIKQVAATYHELNPENVDLILTEDFKGWGENGHTWDRESHRAFLSNGVFKKDSIINQVAEGNWVTTRFIRTMDYREERISAPAMHFKRFEGNKIAELWEYFDYTE